jgi:hypothetical protein
MKLYVYHYHAFCDLAAGKTAHMDGLTATTAPILNASDYFALRERVAVSARDKGYAIRAEELVLSSITFLGEKDE